MPLKCMVCMVINGIGTEKNKIVNQLYFMVKIGILIISVGLYTVMFTLCFNYN